jgi:hypothetical protein
VSTPTETLDREERARRGRALYEERIRPRVEAGNRGKFLVINLDSGDFEMDESDLVAGQKADARFGSAAQLMLRVGYPAAYYLGGQSNREAE